MLVTTSTAVLTIAAHVSSCCRAHALSVAVAVLRCWHGQRYVTSQVTTAPFDRKLVRQAQDDAAAFVASDGQIRGARLEAALESLRHNCARHTVGDLELAQAILVQ